MASVDATGCFARRDFRPTVGARVGPFGVDAHRRQVRAAVALGANIFLTLALARSCCLDPRCYRETCTLLLADVWLPSSPPHVGMDRTCAWSSPCFTVTSGASISPPDAPDLSLLRMNVALSAAVASSRGSAPGSHPARRPSGATGRRRQALGFQHRCGHPT